MKGYSPSCPPAASAASRLASEQRRGPMLASQRRWSAPICLRCACAAENILPELTWLGLGLGLGSRLGSGLGLGLGSGLGLGLGLEHLARVYHEAHVHRVRRGERVQQLEQPLQDLA